VSESFAISQGTQTIAFTPPGAQVFTPGGTVTLNASASSGLAVGFTSTTTGVCTTSGTNGATVTFVSAGSCAITASQAGDANYAAAEVSESFAISQGTQTITFTPPAAQVFTPGGTVTLNASASSGLPVSFTSTTTGVCTTSGTNGATVSFVAVGTCAITARQAGDANYDPAEDVERSFDIGQDSQTIIFPDPVQTNFVPGQQVALTATASSGLPVQFSSLTQDACTVTTDGLASFVKPGACIIAADQPGNATFAPAARVSKTLNIGGVNPAVEVELITKMQAARARALVLTQPDLAPLLDASSEDSTALSLSSKGSEFDLIRTGGPLWSRLSGSITEQTNGAREHYVQLSFGTHITAGAQSILGVMATFDSIRISDPAGQAEGTGWLIGPYFVTRLGTSDAILELRSLTGLTDDRIAQEGVPFSSFEGKRSLLMAKLSGTVAVDDSLTLSPSMSLASVDQASAAYLAFGGTPIPSVNTSYRQAALNLNLKHVSTNSYGLLTVTGGLGLFMDDVSGVGDGQGITYAFGLAQQIGDDTNISIDVLGQRDVVNDANMIGLSLTFESRF
jgi:hypothetical protein